MGCNTSKSAGVEGASENKSADASNGNVSHKSNGQECKSTDRESSESNGDAKNNDTSSYPHKLESVTEAVKEVDEAKADAEADDAKEPSAEDASEAPPPVSAATVADDSPAQPLVTSDDHPPQEEEGKIVCSVFIRKVMLLYSIITIANTKGTAGSGSVCSNVKRRESL